MAFFLCQLRNRDCPSVIPLIGGLFLYAACRMYPDGLLRPWAGIGLFIDYGCMPYLISASIYIIREEIRFAKKNRLLSLEYDAPAISGEIAVYPANECIHKWRHKDGMSSGSMIMKVDNYLMDRALSISVENLTIEFRKDNGQWSVHTAKGLGDHLDSLKYARVSEFATVKPF